MTDQTIPPVPDDVIVSDSDGAETPDVETPEPIDYPEEVPA